MADTKWSQLPSATPGNSDEVVGLHSGDNARFTIANIIAAVRQGLENIFVPLTRTINGKALNNDIFLSASDTGAQAKITASGILKGDGQGGVSAATPGTDYQTPLTAGTDYATPAQFDGKANQAQLAYVETGITASRNYTAGQYISLNGLLYTADTAIASGATFYASGGGKNLTECAGGGFNSLHQKTKDFVKIATYTTGGNYPLAYSSYSEFILVFVLAGAVRLAEYVPASLFSVGSRWRITQDGAAYFDVLFNSGNTIACQVSNGNYSGSFGEIWAR